MAEGRRRRQSADRAGRAGSGAARSAIPDADRIIDVTMALVAERGWRGVSLATVAEAAGLTTLQVYRIFPSKAAILCGLSRRIDEAVLAAPPEAEAGERPRDRLFDILMRRFDALQPYREALNRLRRDLPFDPPSALVVGAAVLCSMRWMLDGAGIAASGIGGVIAVKLTTAAYLAASHTWSGDDSPDLAPTMATLDRRLRGIETWLGRSRSASGGRETAEA
jgi:AcrR family transcriptional regulator